MNLKQIENARRAMDYAGTLADRNQLRSRLIAATASEVESLRQARHAVRADFRRRLERWRTEEVREDVAVCAIPSDVHNSRLYRLTGFFALLCEMGLAAWIFLRLGVPWWLGALVAIGVTVTLHDIFLHLFDNPERPKETVYRIRRLASLPAIFVFLVALGLSVLARYVTGALALLLLPVFSFALWLATLSLIILAASLFTLAHVHGWSLRHEKVFRQFDADERASSDFLKELQGEAASKSASAVAVKDGEAPQARPDGKVNGTQVSLGAIAVLAIALGSGTGCTVPPSGEAQASATVEASATAATLAASPAATARVVAGALYICIDSSGSCVRSPLEEAWRTVRAELPEIVERHAIGHLRIASFDEDGWCPKPLREISLPALNLPTRSQPGGTEWDTFRNIRDAVRDAEDSDWKDRKKAVEDHYRRTLAEALKPIESARVLPEPGYASAQSDIVGLLQRISQTREPHPQFVVVLTDLADTRYKVFPRIPAPEGDVHLLVLLLPAQPKDALLTIGKALSGPEQYELRARQLQGSAPWAVVAPYFAKNLAALFRPARQRD